MNYPALKERMYQQCLGIVEDRLATITINMDALMEAKTSETKSSAGDKYETGMAMIQNQEELYTRQRAETTVIYNALLKIDPTKVCEQVENGALVLVPGGMFYICAGMGRLVLDDTAYFAISLISPIGAALKFKKAGTFYTYNDKNVPINSIY
ncbi:MAG: transcription elongation factor [Nonlabens sp.]|nr:transcription elongation factor [Nonlabens sp.]